MANTYRVMPGLLSHLAHIFEKASLELSITGSKEAQAYKLFSLFLGLKISLSVIFRDGIYWPLGIPVLVLFSWRATRSRADIIDNLILCAAFLFSLFEIWQSWPFTINHNFLECGILLLMCLMPYEQKIAKNSEHYFADINIVKIIKILMMSVWFYSGLHKLLDGYYWNAEFFALEALSNNTVIGDHLNQILKLVSWSDDQNYLSCCVNKFLPFNTFQTAVLLFLSWGTIAAEIFFPILLLIPKFRTISVILLFICQAFITYFSGEIDFAFSAFAILFLFVPRLAPLAYPSLAIIFLLVQPWT